MWEPRRLTTLRTYTACYLLPHPDCSVTFLPRGASGSYPASIVADTPPSRAEIVLGALPPPPHTSSWPGDYAYIQRCLSRRAHNSTFVRSSVRTHETTRTAGQIFMKLDMESFNKICWYIPVLIKKDKNNGCFTWRPNAFLSASRP
jgi:hypothetical protein